MKKSLITPCSPLKVDVLDRLYEWVPRSYVVYTYVWTPPSLSELVEGAFAAGYQEG